MTRREDAPVIILGAGPAGLTAAYELSQNGVPSIVLERDSVVGGLARTVEYKGCRFDIGGHRFYTKLSYIEQIWKDILGKDLLIRPRLSRIYYRSKFFRYPLEPLEALARLGPVEAVACLASFVQARLVPSHPEDDFETWVSNRFGPRLFRTFFKSYTEKVWGIPCSEISAEWGNQRIRGLSVSSLIRDMLTPSNGHTPKTLSRTFYYPRLGPGMMWSRMREVIEGQNARVVLNSPVEEILWSRAGITAVRAGGTTYTADRFISSIPLRGFIRRLTPPAPDSVRRATDRLHYRDFITVALIVRGRNLFPDNWIYIHDPAMAVGRIQNYGNWSPDMTPDPAVSCLGLEYFCHQGDRLWTMPDAELMALSTRELAALGLVEAGAVIDGKVVRVPKAYPVYDAGHMEAIAAAREFQRTVPNLQLVGRNGMHRYNNQDHSMLTGILAARNALGQNHDLWNLGLDPEYLEDGSRCKAEEVLALAKAQPAVPGLIAAGGRLGFPG